MENETIAAISTPMGEGAIGIVRLSGPKAISIADTVYRGATPLASVASHTIHYGKIIDAKTEQRLEEVMVSVMKAPKTFTKEDVVEVNCHGGVVSIQRILQLLLRQGARLAEPGEFTKRAFLNGRIDLSQAEAVMDLIRAKTDQAMTSAMHQVEGRLANAIETLRQQVLEALAQVEVNIDYPEYDDVEEMTQQTLVTYASQVRTSIDALLTTASQGKILREGLHTAIIGRPNVGKSSLLNSLAHDTRAIVTEVPGTTRDVIEEYVNVRGVPLKLIDTAGIRETEDIVERIGVERSRKVLQEAELILLVINQNEPLTDEEERLFEATKEFNVIVILNKTDLPINADRERIELLAKGRPIVATSLLNEEGLEALEQAIASLFFESGVESGDSTYVSNSRHIALLHEARQAVEDVIQGVESGMPVDIVQIDMQKAWELLGEITGDTVGESLIDQLFSQFCLGK
ncbi:tRNA uridine-5-carboxymethylaminomethyl(34) synthesis GTPase MnmE [Aureibacillus halotolerans]|uniref:tRNA modification GTPase MnmE n=1 Tax=Aureibacillus halotolerans TaxID=1508390 RepID=A0A4R6U1W3_9BACI|nr:tRNA uridine-5-carboxymethylaminomethyl(34) synthesis GTPase MnmE [Aureibacillus halotolerans]TDQ38345.1 tRNA modification GTPase trmE [Aureibacillus halotolerans]